MGKKLILSNMNYHPGLAEAKPVKKKTVRHFPAGASLEHGCAQLEKKQASDALYTNLWFT